MIMMISSSLPAPVRVGLAWWRLPEAGSGQPGTGPGRGRSCRRREAREAIHWARPTPAHQLLES